MFSTLTRRPSPRTTMDSVPTPSRPSQSLAVLAAKTGPLSEQMCPGSPKIRELWNRDATSADHRGDGMPRSLKIWSIRGLARGEASPPGVRGGGGSVRVWPGAEARFEAAERFAGATSKMTIEPKFCATQPLGVHGVRC